MQRHKPAKNHKVSPSSDIGLSVKDYISKLPQAEWDFSDVKQDHRPACVEWEYYREIPEYISAVARCITERERFYSDGSYHCFENELVGLKHDPPHRFFEEWPNTPFTLLPDWDREIFISYAFGTREIPPRYLLVDTSFSDGLTTLSQVLAFADANGHPVPADRFPGEEKWPTENAVQFVVFQLDRDASPEALLEQFYSFLQHQPAGFRPPEVQVREERGEGGISRQAATQLRALGAYRLLKKMTWKEAHVYTAAILKEGGKGLYGGRYAKPWNDAAALARRLIEQKRKEMLYTSAGVTRSGSEQPDKVEQHNDERNNGDGTSQ